MTHRQFFFIELLIEKLDYCLYEWRAEPHGGGDAIERGSGESIEDCLRDAQGVVGAADGVELRYDGYCAGTFVGSQLVENPALYATKASDLTRYFKAVEASMY
ncbi:hypothetical protein Q3O97_16610 [Ralstonia pseudosolanacearum]|uniref:hypothetical protein n=1 Tax=Ralstonia pseudosolanacearum TaxID=1310165 RepID=UPI0026FFD842|nr:hypothetical protein [Ralstonia pseudosolanacearum]MDO3617472.1 hypothetical protein [Ralstonia pseudosolanacearum]